MEPIATRIAQLTDSELVEAAGFYLADTIHAHSLPELEDLLAQESEAVGGDVDALQAIRGPLAQDRDSYRDLLCLLLRYEGQHANDARRQRLETAISAVGQKQVVPGVDVIATLALVALLQLTRKKKTVRVEKKPDGTVHYEFEEERGYANPATALGRLFGWFAALPPGGSDNESHDGTHEA